MNDRVRRRAAIVAVVFWTALAVWRESTAAYVNHAEKRALRHYAVLASEVEEPLHPVRWGPRVLVPKRKRDRRQYAEVYLVSNGPIERVWLAGGDVLGRVPALVLHGVFATLAVLLVRRGPPTVNSQLHQTGRLADRW